MRAETAYNVIQALSVDEVPKLYELLGIQAPVKKKRKKLKFQQEEIALEMDKLKARLFNKKRVP